MKIALSQINTTVGDLEGNFIKVVECINSAKEQKCDIIVFPELTLSGYTPEDLLLKEHFIWKQFQYVQKLANEIKDIIVILGYIQPRPNDKPYNACTVFKDGKELARHYKYHLPNYSVFDEKRYFSKGEEYQSDIFECKNKKITINICEDIWVDNGISLKQNGYEPNIMINISCSPYYINKIKERKILLTRRAKEYDIDICYCNLVGGQDELVFDGGSMIINAEGEIVAKSYQFKEDLLIHEIGKSNPLPCEFKEEKEIWEALKIGLRDYIHKNGFDKVILGMSGGIDSALVAKLAVDTLGRKNVHCISMPSKYSSEGTKSDAKEFSNQLGVNFNEIPIKDLVDKYTNVLSPSFLGMKEDITEENLQARIRGNIIMALSNKFGYLPLSTGNKSEVSVGYCTLYGDMNGGFNPIKDLYKTQVYALAKFVGVPETIINRKPSAELREDQNDQQTLPDYEVLDEILKKLMEENKAPSTELEKKIAKLLRINEFKRRQSCPGIKITKRSYGKDYRMPIVNGYYE